jgi:hypothetical protein
MSISSTGIYGVNSTIVTSDLYEDVEQLKTNLTTLTTSHLSVASNHDGRLDILEGDNTSNITRIGDLEIDVSSNKSNITSNTTRIDTLEDDNTSNIERLDTLELDNTDNKARLTDAEDQIFDVVHEPNKHEQELFYFTPYPVPYDVLEAYSQLRPRLNYSGKRSGQIFSTRAFEFLARSVFLVGLIRAFCPEPVNRSNEKS